MHTFEFIASLACMNEQAFDVHRSGLEFEDENYLITFRPTGLEMSVGDVTHLTAYSPDDVLAAFKAAFEKQPEEVFTFTLTI